MRPNYLDKAFPEIYAALIDVSTKADRAALDSGLQPLLIELVKIRASQLNGCAFCLRMHTRDAISKGETADRLAVVSTWRDTDYFTEAERAALAITEEITLIADVTSGRRAADTPHPELTEAQTAAVRWIGIAINAFNRVSITSHHPVDPDDKVPAGVPKVAAVSEYSDESGYPDQDEAGEGSQSPDIPQFELKGSEPDIVAEIADFTEVDDQHG